MNAPDILIRKIEITDIGDPSVGIPSTSFRMTEDMYIDPEYIADFCDYLHNAFEFVTEDPTVVLYSDTHEYAYRKSTKEVCKRKIMTDPSDDIMLEDSFGKKNFVRRMLKND